jgi:sugar phosphate isomerase/epimerase
MKRVLSTHLFADHRLTTVWLDKIWQAKIPAVEIFCARQHIDWRDRAQLRDLAAWFRDSELELHSLHSPMFTDDVWGRSGPHAVINIAEPVKSKRVQMVDEIKRSLEIAEMIPCRYLIQHIGVADEEYDERKVDAAFTALEELNIYAHQRGVAVLLENIPNGFSNAERLAMFLETTHLDLGFCLDVGHAHIMEGVEHAFSVMKSRIRSVHLHDNDGRHDQHLFPLSPEGTVDWKKTMELLRSTGNGVPLLLEVKEPPGMSNTVEVAAKAFEKLENC